MQEKIAVYISPNERGSDRAKHLALAISEDNRFMLPVFKEIDVDLQFLSPGIKWAPEKPLSAPIIDYSRSNIFNVELKEPADYVSSALGKDGHLYNQILTMREAGHPCCIIVLGSDDDVSNACKEALRTRYRGQELSFQLGSYIDRIIDFEARCEALWCPVRRWKSQPWRRLLSTAHKVLMGADLYGYRPRPAENEREICAAATLFKGIGPEIMKNVLSQYQLGFVPRGDYATPIEELPGIGKKRCAQISPLVRMIYSNRVRA